MPRVLVNTCAKINWVLNIKGLRPDGYHDLDTLMQSVTLADNLFIEPCDSDIEVACGNGLHGDENIAAQAAAVFFEAVGHTGGARILIEKRIPLEAGLAGGSADAGGVLMGLNAIFGQPLTLQRMILLAVKIGADVPFSLLGGCARANGIGEILTPVRANCAMELLLAKPDTGIVTRQAFAAYDHLEDKRGFDIEAVIRGLQQDDLHMVARNMGNALQYVSSAVCPDILDLCRLMGEVGAIGACMTGSGSAVIGLFKTAEKARSAERRIRKKYWCQRVNPCERSISITSFD